MRKGNKDSFFDDMLESSRTLNLLVGGVFDQLAAHLLRQSKETNKETNKGTNKMKNIIIYHRDADGITSAGIIGKLHEGESCEYIATNYGEQLPELNLDKETRVYILDYSLDNDTLSDIITRVQEVVWIDHHASAIDKANAFDEGKQNQFSYKDLKGIRRTGKAACELCWEYAREELGLYDEHFFNMLIHCVGTYDVKRLDDKMCTPNGALTVVKGFDALAVTPEKVASSIEWSRPSDAAACTIYSETGLYKRCYDTGTAVINYLKNYEYPILHSNSFRATIHKKYSDPANKGYYSVLVANVPFKGSAQLDAIYDKKLYDFMAVYHKKGSEYYYSFYHHEDSDIDLGVVATNIAAEDTGIGGGHPGAAGCVLNYDLFAQDTIELPRAVKKLIDPTIEYSTSKDEHGYRYLPYYEDLWQYKFETDFLRKLEDSDTPKELFDEYVFDLENKWCDDDRDVIYRDCIKEYEGSDLYHRYGDIDDLIRDYVEDQVYLEGPYKSLLAVDVPVNIIIDTGDANYDFDHNRASSLKDGISSISWLCKKLKWSTAKLKACLNGDEVPENKVYESVVDEVANCYSMGHLAFFATISIGEYIDLLEAIQKESHLNQFDHPKNRKGTGTITVAKGISCGIYDSFDGCGSMLGIEIPMDMSVPVKIIHRAEVDYGSRNYGIGEIYGAVSSFWTANGVVNINAMEIEEEGKENE